jgi:hypothetical protein
MAFGSWRRFKTKKEAEKHRDKAWTKGCLVSKPEKRKDGMWYISILTKKGKNPIYLKGI